CGLAEAVPGGVRPLLGLQVLLQLGGGLAGQDGRRGDLGAGQVGHDIPASPRARPRGAVPRRWFRRLDGPAHPLALVAGHAQHLLAIHAHAALRTPRIAADCTLTPVRVLAAPDKFRGTATAPEAAGAIADGWRRARPRDRVE